MKYFSMFTGVGGFELGIEQAYEKIRIRRNRSSRSLYGGSPESLSSKKDVSSIEKPFCIGFSEIDRYASQLLKNKWSKVRNYGDARGIVPEDLPDFDLLVGGFPCQAFSIAGKRRGFEDTRGTLFFEIARILKAKQPRLILLENVKGLLSHDRGETFRTIITTLNDLGYDLQWQVLNSKNFGVPQNRERVFIVGHLRGTPRPKVFPVGENDKSHIVNEGRSESKTKPASTISTHEGSRKENNYIVQLNQPNHSNDRVYGDKGISPTLNTMQGGRRQPKLVIPKHKVRVGNPKVEEIQPYLREWLIKSSQTISNIERLFGTQAPHHWFEKIKFASLPEVDDWFKLKEILGFDDKYDKLMTEHRLMTDWEIMQEHKERHQAKGNGFGVVIKTPKETGSTLTAFSDRTDAINTGMMIRRLTPLECERLQGFPDNWTQGFSDTQRYKMMGNAVTVNVVRHIAERLI